MMRSPPKTVQLHMEEPGGTTAASIAILMPSTCQELREVQVSRGFHGGGRLTLWTPLSWSSDQPRSCRNKHLGDLRWFLQGFLSIGLNQVGVFFLSCNFLSINDVKSIASVHLLKNFWLQIHLVFCRNCVLNSTESELELQLESFGVESLGRNGRYSQWQTQTPRPISRLQRFICVNEYYARSWVLAEVNLTLLLYRGPAPMSFSWKAVEPFGGSRLKFFSLYGDKKYL